MDTTPILQEQMTAGTVGAASLVLLLAPAFRPGALGIPRGDRNLLAVAQLQFYLGLANRSLPFFWASSLAFSVISGV